MKTKNKDRRKVEVHTGFSWKEIKFKDLKIGNRFRLFDNGIQVTDEIINCKEFVATSLPYINEKGIGEIKVKYYLLGE